MSTNEHYRLPPVGVETIPGPDGQSNYSVERTVEPAWVWPATVADGEWYVAVDFFDLDEQVHGVDLTESDWGPF